MSRIRKLQRTQHTQAPLQYVTGGLNDRSNAADCCDLAAVPDNTPWPQAMNGGPIDAPDWMPTGALLVTHGRRYFSITHREQ